MHRLLAIAAALLTSSTPALADPPSNTTSAPAEEHAHVITYPRWARMPSRQDFLDAYPMHAAIDRQDGLAVIHCDVAVSGDLENCVVTKEDPRGFGFGAAALALSRICKMVPAMRDGVPIAGGTINIPFRWR